MDKHLLKSLFAFFHIAQAGITETSLMALVYQEPPNDLVGSCMIQSVLVAFGSGTWCIELGPVDL